MLTKLKKKWKPSLQSKKIFKKKFLFFIFYLLFIIFYLISFKKNTFFFNFLSTNSPLFFPKNILLKPKNNKSFSPIHLHQTQTGKKQIEEAVKEMTLKRNEVEIQKKKIASLVAQLAEAQDDLVGLENGVVLSVDRVELTKKDGLFFFFFFFFCFFVFLFFLFFFVFLFFCFFVFLFFCFFVFLFFCFFVFVFDLFYLFIYLFISFIFFFLYHWYFLISRSLIFEIK